MFEHAHRHDAVELAGDCPIIHQLEPDAAGKTRRRSPGPGDLQLFVRKRDARHLCAMVARQRQRQPAPATTDVQNPHPRCNQKLARDMRRLGLLCGFKGLARISEIGAGILPVGVQKEIVDFWRQIIMMRHIALRAPGGVGLIQPPPPLAQHAHGAGG